MDGIFHYRQAERLIALADESTDPTVIEGGWETTTDIAELETRAALMASAQQEARDFIAIAQVHATLALAAATALANHVEMSNTDANAWTVAASASTSYRDTAADMLARDPSARGHRDPSEVADVIAMRAEMAQAAGDDGSDVTS